MARARACAGGGESSPHVALPQFFALSLWALVHRAECGLVRGQASKHSGMGEVRMLATCFSTDSIVWSLTVCLPAVSLCNRALTNGRWSCTLSVYSSSDLANHPTPREPSVNVEFRFYSKASILIVLGAECYIFDKTFWIFSLMFAMVFKKKTLSWGMIDILKAVHIFSVCNLMRLGKVFWGWHHLVGCKHSV